MSNADLIAEARLAAEYDRYLEYEGGRAALLTELADALEVADTLIAGAISVLAIIREATTEVARQRDEALAVIKDALSTLESSDYYEAKPHKASDAIIRVIGILSHVGEHA